MRQDQEFFLKKENDVLSKLGSSREGLKEEEAKKRLKEYGPNLIEKKKFGGVILFLRQFRSPLMWILIVTSTISMLLGQLTNSIIIFFMILLGSLLSFFNEYKSEKIVENLNKKISHKALVLRDNKKIEISTSEIVPGDIVYLSIGSMVPADLRLIETKNLEVNEAIISGESLPVEKNSDIFYETKQAKYFKNYGLMGTVVVSGEGIGVAVFTGQDTEFGKISKEIVSEKPQTEFEKGLTKFGGLLLKVILLLTIGIFFVNALLKHDFLNSLLFSLAIAVGLTPELLPTILSVSLSKGANRMAKKEVIVKRLISIEDFGNMDVLCTDKTGTLTEGKIELREHFDLNGKSNERVLLYSYLCNSTFVHGNKLIGDPIDVAIFRHADIKLKKESEEYRKIYTIPFDYTRKRMSVIVKNENKSIIITKGSFQTVLSNCKRAYVNNKELSLSFYRDKLENKYKELSSKGFRVIAVAYKKIQSKPSYDQNDESSLIFLGFITFFDPPKAKVKESIKRLEALNIKLKILTGDNEIITKKVAEDVDIHLNRIVLAEEIDKLDDNKLLKVVEEGDAFCRLDPHQKARIIRALKKNGHDVGFMGDGINDVPALHEADVAITIDDAVDVAKEASDITLLKKNLDVLSEGVVEGRKIFNNTVKYVLMGTSSNFGNMFSAAGASIFLPFLPMLPIQILLVNFLYDFSQVTISSDNVDEEELKKPKKFRVSYIGKYMLTIGPMSSIYDFLTYFLMLYVFKAKEALFRTGWFIESLMTQVLVIFVIRTKRKPFYKSKPGKYVVLTCLVAVFLSIAIPFSPLSGILGFEKPPTLYFIILIVMTITYLVLVEFVKNWFFKKYEI